MGASLEITINAEPAERAEHLLGRWTDGRCAGDHDQRRARGTRRASFGTVDRWSLRSRSRITAESAERAEHLLGRWTDGRRFREPMAAALAFTFERRARKEPQSLFSFSEPMGASLAITSTQNPQNAQSI